MKISLLFLAPMILAFYQNDYKLKIERFKILHYNKEFISNLKVNHYFYSRTEKRLNASGTILQDIGNDVTFSLQAYKFSSNEYRIFPMVYKSHPCNDRELQKFGIDIKKIYTNFTTCPVKKGSFYIANVHYNDSTFPPHAPRGRYMLESEIKFNSLLSICTLQVFIEITPTDVLEKMIF